MMRVHAGQSHDVDAVSVVVPILVFSCLCHTYHGYKGVSWLLM